MARRRQIGLQQNQDAPGSTGGSGAPGEGGGGEGGQNRSPGQGRPRRRWRPRNQNTQAGQNPEAPRPEGGGEAPAGAASAEGQPAVQGQQGQQRSGQRRRGRRGGRQDGGQNFRPRQEGSRQDSGRQDGGPQNTGESGQAAPGQEPKKLLPSQRPEFAGEGDISPSRINPNRNRGRSRGRKQGSRPGQQGQPGAHSAEGGTPGTPQGEQRQIRPDIGKQGIRQGSRQNTGRPPREDRPQYSLPRTFDPNDPERPSGGQRAPQRGAERGRNNRGRNTFNRSDRFDRPAPSIPIKTDRGIKARSQRGAFSKNWWAKSWIEAMERLVDPGRLQRGRSYARSGQVLSLQETKHGVEATVQGSRPQPYKVNIQVTPLSNEQWERVIDALAEQALFTAQLLAGEMPPNIEEAFHMAEVSLFPDQAGDLFTSCSCPDWANPCKHVAATHYILGERFDDDPFLLFRMRGRSQGQILQGLRQRRAGDADAGESEQTLSTGQPLPPLEELVDTFWETPEPLDEFPLTIRPPAMDMPLLKRLGEPAFLGGESLQAILKPVYDIFTRSALRAAYSEEEPMEKQPDENGNGNGT